MPEPCRPRRLGGATHWRKRAGERSGCSSRRRGLGTARRRPGPRARSGCAPGRLRVREPRRSPASDASRPALDQPVGVQHEGVAPGAARPCSFAGAAPTLSIPRAGRDWDARRYCGRPPERDEQWRRMTGETPTSSMPVVGPNRPYAAVAKLSHPRLAPPAPTDRSAVSRLAMAREREPRCCVAQFGHQRGRGEAVARGITDADQQLAVRQATSRRTSRRTPHRRRACSGPSIDQSSTAAAVRAGPRRPASRPSSARARTV